MKTIIISIISTLCILTFTLAQDHEERTLNVDKGGTLKVKLSVGDISLTTWDKNQMLIRYDKDEDADFEITKNGNDVEIKSSDYSWGDDLSITLPSQFDIDLKTMGGDIKLNGSLSGRFSCETSGGDIRVGSIKGNTDLSTAGGDIRANDITGDAHVRTAGGDIEVSLISGKASVITAGGNIDIGNIGSSADIKTAGGNIRMKNINGEAKVTTGGGNIQIGKISGTAEIMTGGGNISVANATKGMEVKTGAGEIEIENLTGNLEAKTGAGDIVVDLSSNYSGNCDINSGMGSLRLLVPSDLKATINATVKSTGWGSENNIVSDFPASGLENGKKNIHRQFIVNGGGSEINLTAGFGDIIIKKK